MTNTMDKTWEASRAFDRADEDFLEAGLRFKKEPNTANSDALMDAHQRFRRAKHDLDAAIKQAIKGIAE